MTRCQNCRAETQNYLCTSCTTQLANMCSQLPWLLDELDARIQKLDRISVGTIGRTRRPDHLNVMDFDAAETARRTRKLLVKWVETVAERHTGRQPPAVNTVATKQLAKWLEANTNAITLLDCAGQIYHDIQKLVGTLDHPGQLHNAINPHERHPAGPCPTTIGRNHDGTPRQCGRMLFADTYDQTTTCPDCKQTIDVEQNRKQAAADRDLHTRTDLAEVLNNIDEPVTQQQLDQWIKARRLRPQGWKHDGTINEHNAGHDEPVYSVARARKLRRRDEQLTRLRHTLAEQR